ncbi:hypothetical protein B0H16DRAFT_1836659 [Mycena metata]|uniref:Uncharacterized protein n=1 Tax=Mycena metata TaxID=1033252 RepID=A0AAD7DUB2_9AGAR|nr:hypothetical protein B0H16DRAFT_1836659 [Mycena metata]
MSLTSAAARLVVPPNQLVTIEIGTTSVPLAPQKENEPGSDGLVSHLESPTPSKIFYHRPWHRRLKVAIPRTPNPSSTSTPSSPRSPLSPLRLWSAVQRGASSLPVVRLRPKNKLPSAPCRPPSESLAVAALAQHSLDREIIPDESVYTSLAATPTHDVNDTDDKELLVYHPYAPRPVPYDHRPAWYIPAHSPAPEPTTPTKTKAKPRTRFEDPSSYRWPEHQIMPPTPSPSPIVTDSDSLPERGELPCPDLRWYHPFLLLFLWNLFIVSLSTFVILRVILKPLVCILVVALLVQLFLYFC